MAILLKLFLVFLEIKCKRIPPTFLPSLYKSFGHLIPKDNRLGDIPFSVTLATNKANIIGNNFGALSSIKNFKGKINKNLGATEWTSILVHFVNRADENGLIEVFIDGSEKPAYRFEGPLYSNVGNKKPKVKKYKK